MMPTQRMVLCLVFVALLAVLVHAATVDLTNVDKNLNDPRTERAKRDTLARRFQELVDYLASILGMRSKTFNLMQNLKFPNSRTFKASTRREPQAAQSQALRSSSFTCNPACKTGSQCCLLPPGASVPSCQSTLLSGSSCGWNHYTSSNPNTTVPLQKSICPCMLGLGCVGATKRGNGVCTFF